MRLRCQAPHATSCQCRWSRSCPWSDCAASPAESMACRRQRPPRERPQGRPATRTGRGARRHRAGRPHKHLRCWGVHATALLLQCAGFSTTDTARLQNLQSPPYRMSSLTLHKTIPLQSFTSRTGARRQREAGASRRDGQHRRQHVGVALSQAAPQLQAVSERLASDTWRRLLRT